MPKFTVLLFLVLFFASNLAISQPSPSIVAEPVAYSQALYYNHTSHIARTSDDRLFTVWTSSGTDGQIVYSEYDPAFQIWSPAAPISNNPSGGTAHKAGIAADDAGNLYAAWQQRNTSGEDYAIYFSRFDGSNWSAPVNLTGNNLENEEVGIEVDDQGNLFVAWNTDGEPDSSEWILCLRSTDGGSIWTGPDTLSSPDGVIGGGSVEAGRPFLARGPNGKMVCTWFEEPTGGLGEEIYLNQFDGASWSGEQLVSDTTALASRYPTAVINAAEEIFEVWRPNLPLRHLAMKKKAWNAPNWPTAIDTVVGQGFSAYKPYMGMDSNENLYVVFRRDMENDTTGLEQINYVSSGDGGQTWSSQTRLSRETHDGGYVTLASRIRSSGVDVFWREGYQPFAEDPDTLSLVYGHIDLLSSIDEDPNTIAESFELKQNYPNPFNPSTSISYRIGRKGDYQLSVYNLLGQKIRTLISGEWLQGDYKITWDGKDETGNSVSSGIYFYQLKGEGVQMSRKMMLVR